MEEREGPYAQTKGRPHFFGEEEKEKVKALVEDNDPPEHRLSTTMWDTKTPTFIRFLDKIADWFSGNKILPYMDSFRVHTSAKVRRFLKLHGNIKVRFMPPYFPCFNPQEY